MENNDPAMTRRRAGESGATFASRLAMIDRLAPVLRSLTADGFSLVIESQRREEKERTLASDAVLELGDVRLRVILRVGESPVVPSHALTTELQRYLLDTPDTEALVVVADDEELTAWVLDLYDLTSDWRDRPGTALRLAISEFKDRNVAGVGVPRIRDAFALPSRDELDSILADVVLRNLEQVRTSKVRIPEKAAALHAITEVDGSRLVVGLQRALQGESIDVASLVDPEDLPSA